MHPHRSFLWIPSFVGGMVAIGISALFGTLVANVSLWVFLSQGLNVQEAYARLGSFDFFTPSALLSLLVLFFAGLYGGFLSAQRGGNLHLLQALIAGVIANSFFLVMSLGPSAAPTPTKYIAVHIFVLLSSSLIGGYWYAKRT
ncbi:hypothetical protein [Ideonella oryzae]|uniref:TIGR04086 family membrane protein n=1 Tax=Ideonella oryzae TaxID=2937441 RepID=A0ABT1BV12_9BURK|nr:hypothetical protein [Ideonella oryzae]MCO5979357.1 hypothetical protein [Ideonella oryzae]